MQINATSRFHLTPVGIAEINKTTNAEENVVKGDPHSLLVGMHPHFLLVGMHPHSLLVGKHP